MRVALISFDFGEVCLALANALSEHVEVALALPAREVEPLRDRFDPRVRVLPFRAPRLRQPMRQARMCRGIMHEARRFAPDVVHLQQGHLWFNVGLPLLRLRPLVVTIHDHTPHLGDRASLKTPQIAMNLAFRRADRLIVHAERLKREVVALRGVPEDLVHVIPHVAIGDEVGRAAPDPAASSRVAEEDNVVLFFGRIWPYKGLEHLIRAEPMVSERVPDARFVIAGEGEEFDRYRRMMVNPERFEVYNEFVSLERRSQLFDGAAVVVLPYVEATQSGVVPVAYSFSKPVVATNVGGLPEVVEDGRTGFVIPPQDEQALADAIVALLKAPTLRREMGAAGRARQEREWSPARVAEQTLEVYELALQAHTRGLAEAA